MTPSTHDARPPYQQAADALRSEIKAGKLKPGEQPPRTASCKSDSASPT
ncbi:GntR family transcriptional regulator [Streptomyces malaysiensis]|nr:hypothetical protein [Streptomyces samsunensis]